MLDYEAGSKNQDFKKEERRWGVRITPTKVYSKVALNGNDYCLKYAQKRSTNYNDKL
jgi:hypothetical protein